MVLGLITLAGTIPMTATSVLALQKEAESTKSNGTDPPWKTEKCHIKCRATARSPPERAEILKNSHVVLLNGRLYIQPSTYSGKPLHLFTGYFLPYPDSEYDGLVSTTSNNPPQLNWIYIDTRSRLFQLCHGLRTNAEQGLAGPWGVRVCSDGEKRFLMEGWEGFIAVEDEHDLESGLWKLCYDRYDNGLDGKIGANQRTVEVELLREEMDQ